MSVRTLNTEERYAFLYRVVKATSGEHDLFFVASAGGDVKVYAKCNDTFVWGCSDVEEITPENVEILERSIADLGEHDYLAQELFAARVRCLRPQGASYNECYPRATWHLFDACGPERKVQFGNPVDRAALESRETRLETKK